MSPEKTVFTLDELCALTGMVKRTVRFYVQKGLVDRPEGVKKSAYYTRTHLEQLLTIRKWKEAGISLEKIGAIMRRAGRGVDPLPVHSEPSPGTVEVWSRIFLAHGIELLVDPSKAALTPEQIRTLGRETASLIATMQSQGGE